MQKERMTVHKALAELKIIDSKIAKAISEGVYCIANKASNKKINGTDFDSYVDTVMRASYDRVVDYIIRQKAIKRAVSLSNAITKVIIVGKEYTVAEAIWMRNHGVESDMALVDEMKRQYNMQQSKVNKENEDINERAENYVIGLYGQKEKTNSEEIEKSKQQFINTNQYELVDPINILKVIEDMEKKIDGFMSEVDSVLSVSNALTEIEVEY